MRAAIGLAAALATLTRASALAAPEVVVSISPVHSLVASVMEGVGKPELLVPAGASPHGYALRPSEARRLAKARVVFWVGPELEGWLASAIPTLAPDATAVSLLDGSGQPGAGKASRDPHAWLAPDRAAAMAVVIGDTLAGTDPTNAVRYRTNAAAVRTRIFANAGALRARLAPFRGRGYMVLHDAYRAFTAAMGLVPPAASLAVAHGHPAGASQIRAAREAARTGNAHCILVEPQLSRRIAESIAADTGLDMVPIDPLGASIPLGAGLYLALLESVAKSFVDCLTG